MKRKDIIYWILAAAAGAVLLVLAAAGNKAGLEIGGNFMDFFIEMIKILPFAFILIGQFEVWVPRQTIEKHLGENSGLKAFLWVILLGGATVGTMIAAIPVAAALSRKGARPAVVFAYLGAACVCRIPMTIFEASCIGILFTIIRYLTSIPLIVLSSVLLEKIVRKSEIFRISGDT